MIFIQTSQGIFSIASTFAGMIVRIKTIDIPTIILKSPNINNLAPCLPRAFAIASIFRIAHNRISVPGADLGGGCRGCAPPPEMTCGFLIQLVFYKKKTMWFIGVEVEQETSAPPPKKNSGSAHVFPWDRLNRPGTS